MNVGCCRLKIWPCIHFVHRRLYGDWFHLGGLIDQKVKAEGVFTYCFSLSLRDVFCRDGFGLAVDADSRYRY